MEMMAKGWRQKVVLMTPYTAKKKAAALLVFLSIQPSTSEAQ
jgi:hypothetical protein